jgi:hypothetical protein
MPQQFTDDEIGSYAQQLEKAGAPADEIELFVSHAKTGKPPGEALAVGGAPALTPREVQPQAPADEEPATERAAPAPMAQAAAPADPRAGTVYSFENFKRGLKQLAQDPRGMASLPARSLANAEDVARKNLAPAARFGVPMLAAPGGPAAMVPAAMAGEAAAQMIEDGGRVKDPGAIAKAGFMGAIPVVALARGGVMAQSAKMAGATALAEGLGETAKRSIAQQGFATYEDAGDAAMGMGPVALLGGGIGAVGGAANKLIARGAERAERTAVLKEAGIEKPTLDLIFPSESALAARVATANPAIARMRVDAARPLVDQFEAIAAGAPEHEAVYAALRPYVGKLDAARSEVAALEDLATNARAAADEARAAAIATPDEIAKVTAEASAAELNALNAKARMLHEANANLGGFMDYDATAQEFHGVVDRLFSTRKQIGAAKFGAANVPEDQPIFDKSVFMADAKRALAGRYRGTDMEKQILGAIGDAGGEADALTLGQFRELRSAISNRFAGMDPRQAKAYEAAAGTAYGALTDASKRMIADIPGADLNAYNAAVGYWRETAEAASSRYARPLLSSEPSETTFQSLANDIASGKKAEVRAFNEFVASIAQPAENPVLVQINRARSTAERLSAEADALDAKTALTAVERKRRDALPREIRDAWNEYNVGLRAGREVIGNPNAVSGEVTEALAARGEGSPEVARLAAQQLTKAIRNSFLGNARTGFGVDTRKLTESLARASGNFDVASLGFGSPAEIRRWQGTFQEYGIKNVAQADLEAMFSSPEVQRAALNGASVADAVRPVAARWAYELAVRKQVMADLAGLKIEASKHAVEATQLAQKARLDVETRRKILAEIEADPVAQAFAGGQDFGIPRRPGAGVGTSNAVVDTMLNLGPAGAPRLLAALKQRSPETAEMLQRRLLADTFQFMRSANTPGHVWALDKTKVQKFFIPAAGSPEATHAATVRAIVGPQAFTKYEKLLKAVQMVADVEKAGGIVSSDGAKTIFASSGLARGIAMSDGGGGSSSAIMAGLRAVRGLADKQRFNLLSALATDGKFANAFWSAGGNLSAALKSPTLQRSALLLGRDSALMREVEAEQEEGGRSVLERIQAGQVAR